MLKKCLLCSSLEKVSRNLGTSFKLVKIPHRLVAFQPSAERPINVNYSSAKPFNEIPHPPILPFIGTTWVFMPIIGKYSLNKQHFAAIDKHKVFGDIIRDQFGRLSIVTVFRPEDIETVFRNEGAYPSRGEFSTLKAYRESRKQWYKTTGLMVLQGEEWWSLRSQTQRHLMKPKEIQVYLDPMQDVAKDLVKKISATRDSNLEVPNFLGQLYKWALESVAVVGLDARLGCLEPNLPVDSDGMRMINSVQTQFELMSQLEGFAGNIPFWKYFETPKWRKFKQAADVFTEIAFKYINQAVDELKKKEGNEDAELTLLQAMIATKGMDASRAMVTVADMLMAGIDTTSHAVGFLLYQLARNSDKQELLYDEVKRLLPTKDHKITPETYNNFTYMKSCMKEAQRLLPVVIGTARLLDHDVVLSGYQVPAETIVAFGLSATYLNEKYFKHPERFLPERWLTKEEKPNPFVFLPFGVGVRSCIGKRLAELEIICLVAEILRNFRVEYHHEDIDITTRLISAPDKPLRFNFVER